MGNSEVLLYHNTSKRYIRVVYAIYLPNPGNECESLQIAAVCMNDWSTSAFR
jgi:hypothetical protein